MNLDIAVMISYGQRLLQLCSKIQERVASAIETMTGLTAGTINVHVCGISFEKDEKKSKAAQ